MIDRRSRSASSNECWGPRRAAALLLAAAVVVAGAPSATGTSAEDPGFEITTDPLLSEQWSLFNFGQEIGSTVRGTVDIDIRAPEAWSIARGSSEVIVAITDSGASFDHPDLRDVYWTNPGETGQGRESNGVDDDGNGYIDDWRGWDFVDDDNLPDDLADFGEGSPFPVSHGTSLASIIGASADNGEGMVGLAAGVQIMPVRLLGPGANISEWADALQYAVDNGADVVNMSIIATPLGASMTPFAEVIERNPDVLFVAAAGNLNRNQDNAQFDDRQVGSVIPCTFSYSNVLCVGAIDQDGEIAQFEAGSSSYGSVTVDLAAPGDNMLIAQPGRVALGAVDTGSDLQTALLPGSASDISLSEAEDPERGQVLEWSTPITTRSEDSTAQIEIFRGDLSGYSDCRVNYWIKPMLEGRPADTQLRPQLRATTGSYIGLFGGTVPLINPISERVWSYNSIPIGRQFLIADGGAALSFNVAGSFEAGGTVLLDDLELSCASPDGGGSYAYAEGTSYATPLVAATGALIKSEFPGLTGADVASAILSSVTPSAALQGLTRTGGYLNTYEALRAAAQLEPGTGDPDAAALEAAERTANATEGAGGGGGLVPGLVVPLNPLPVPTSRTPDTEAAGTRDGVEPPAGSDATGSGEGADSTDGPGAGSQGNPGLTRWLVGLALTGAVGAGLIYALLKGRLTKAERDRVEGAFATRRRAKLAATAVKSPKDAAGKVVESAAKRGVREAYGLDGSDPLADFGSKMADAPTTLQEASLKAADAAYQYDRTGMDALSQLKYQANFKDLTPEQKIDIGKHTPAFKQELAKHGSGLGKSGAGLVFNPFKFLRRFRK